MTSFAPDSRNGRGLQLATCHLPQGFSCKWHRPRLADLAVRSTLLLSTCIVLGGIRGRNTVYLAYESQATVRVGACRCDSRA